MTCFFALKSEIASVNRTDIYRQAIKRTFADLYMAFHLELTKGRKRSRLPHGGGNARPSQ
jgi:hypothetical protein